MSLETAIQKQIGEYVSKAEEAFKVACSLERDADILAKNEVWDKSSKKYYDASDLFHRACIFLESIDLITAGLGDSTLEKLRFRKADERYFSHRSQVKEYYAKSADLYKKTSDIYGRLSNRYLQANMLGMAANAYLRIFELSEEKELKTDFKSGEVYSYSETLCGIIVDLFRSAANLFNELGIEFEESGKKSKAYVFYGYMGDAYLSIALVQEKDTYWPFGVVADQAYDYLCAGEAYYKSGRLSKEIGVTSIVQYARIEWRHSERGVFDFFKDKEGYTTADDLRRAMLVYGKAKTLYEKLKMSTQVEYCSGRVAQIQSALGKVEQKTAADHETILRRRTIGKTGYVWADSELLKTLSKLRSCILPDDLDSYEVVLASILGYMGQNLQENFFKGENFDEKSFHKDLLRHLRADHDIGEKALRESSTGGGYVDILVMGIPVELKLEKTEKDTTKAIEKHEKQASQYASAQGKQVGILCILDLTKKEKPIPPPSNDIRVKLVPVHGYEQDKLSSPSMLVVFVIRGNIPQPSGLS